MYVDSHGIDRSPAKLLPALAILTLVTESERRLLVCAAPCLT